MGLQRVGHDLATEQQEQKALLVWAFKIFIFIPYPFVLKSLHLMSAKFPQEFFPLLLEVIQL